MSHLADRLHSTPLLGVSSGLLKVATYTLFHGVAPADRSLFGGRLYAT